MRLIKRFKNLIILIAIIIIIIIFFLWPKNYEKKYKISSYDIKESFKDNRYHISIQVNDKMIDYNFDSKYIGKSIINDIKNISNDNNTCIILSIKDNDSIPLCYNIDYRLIEDIDFSEYKKELKEDVKNYDNINTYNLLNKSYYIWNYKGFIYLNDNEKTNINLFNNDHYNINIATIINNYLAIANYDNSYNFNELILINTKNQNKEIWKLNIDISYESYILGIINDDIYIVDKKNKVEYRLNVKNKEVKTIGTENKDGLILNNGKLEKIEMNKLINNNLEFDYGYDQKFILDNNKLYLETLNEKILISNMDITKIVYYNDSYVYYLVNDTLYYYDVILGEVKIMQDFEWNFNNDSVVFINQIDN